MKKDSIKGILMKINKDDTKSLHTSIGEMMVASGMLVADVDMLGEESGIDIGNSIILLDYSSFNTMYIRRTRIKYHLGLDKSTDLEQWIKDRVVVEK